MTNQTHALTVINIETNSDSPDTPVMKVSLVAFDEEAEYHNGVKIDVFLLKGERKLSEIEAAAKTEAIGFLAELVKRHRPGV